MRTQNKADIVLRAESWQLRVEQIDGTLRSMRRPKTGLLPEKVSLWVLHRGAGHTDILITDRSETQNSLFPRQQQVNLSR